MAGAAVAVLSLAPFGPSRAEVYLENMTSPELAAAVEAGARTVIVPTGGIEQNGGHMVLGKHNIRVRALAGRIAAALGDAIVAPVLGQVPEGGIAPPSGHMVFPGSMTVPPELFAANVEWAARSLRLSGFEVIVLIGDSGWNQEPLAQVAEMLNSEWGGGVLFADAYYDSNATFAEWLAGQGHANAGMHAGLADTSLMLAVDPGAVRDINDTSRVGVGSDPTGASAALGEVGVEMFVSRTVEQVQAFRGE